MFSDELHQFEQVERLADRLPLRTRLNHRFRVADQVFDGVRECGEVEFVEVWEGGEGIGVREGDEGEAGELILFSNFKFLPEDLIVRGLHLRLFILVLGSYRQSLARRRVAQLQVRPRHRQLSIAES